MIAPEPLPPENPDDLGGWLTWGLPGAVQVDRRNLVHQHLKAALCGYPEIFFEVDAGYRAILVTIWPASSLHADIMGQIQNVLEPHVRPDLQIRLFVSETPP